MRHLLATMLPVAATVGLTLGWLVGPAAPAISARQQGCGKGRATGNPHCHPTVSCYVSATPLAFGTYRIFDTQALDTSAEVRIKCGQAKSVSVSLSEGLYGKISQRQMTGPQPTARLAYQVFTDQTRQVVWGTGRGGTQVVRATVSGTSTLRMYARALPLQKVPAGSYSDQLTVLIIF